MHLKQRLALLVTSTLGKENNNTNKEINKLGNVIS